MKNEKVALVFFAYIIGFTTAFIAFVINDSGYSKDDFAVSKKHPVATAKTEDMEAIETYSEIKIVNRSEGLFMQDGDEERVLSAAAINGASGEGFHTDIFASAVSPDGRFVYFCASLVGESGVCTNFVYSVEEDLIYRVTVGEETLKTTAEDAKQIAWISENTLRFSEGWATLENSWSIR